MHAGIKVLNDVANNGLDFNETLKYRAKDSGQNFEKKLVKDNRSDKRVWFKVAQSASKNSVNRHML